MIVIRVILVRSVKLLTLAMNQRRLWLVKADGRLSVQRRLLSHCAGRDVATDLKCGKNRHPPGSGLCRCLCVSSNQFAGHGFQFLPSHSRTGIGRKVSKIPAPQWQNRSAHYIDTYPQLFYRNLSFALCLSQCKLSHPSLSET